MAVGFGHAGAAQADGFHRAFDVLDLDAVADAEWLVHENRHRAEQIRQRVLRRQTDCQTADGEGSDRPGDVDAGDSAP